MLVLVIYCFALLGRHLLSGAQPALQQTLEAEQRKAAKTETADDLSEHTVWQTVIAIVKKPALWGAFLFFAFSRSEEHTSELQSRGQLVCRLLLEKKTRQNRTMK